MDRYENLSCKYDGKLYCSKNRNDCSSCEPNYINKDRNNITGPGNKKYWNPILLTDKLLKCMNEVDKRYN